MEKMKIFIQTPKGKFPLIVKPTTSMKELKDMIEKKSNILPKNQRIRFDGSDIHGDNDATLDDVGIRHRDTLQVEDGNLGNEDTYMVQVGDYQDAFTYTLSPKKKVTKIGQENRSQQGSIVPRRFHGRKWSMDAQNISS